MKDMYICSLLDLIKSTRESAEIMKKSYSKDMIRTALAYQEGYENGLKFALVSIFHLSEEEIEKRLNDKKGD